MIHRKFAALFILIIAAVFSGCGSVKKAANSGGGQPDVTDGSVRLTLYENTGSFSFLFVPDAASAVYEPLFLSDNPKSSYLTLSVNGRTHRLGDSKAFTTKIERQAGDPAFVFQSQSLTVTQVFSPIRTISSPNANGVKITITVENTGDNETMIGLRFLLDTALGENKGGIPFVTDNHEVSGEMALAGDSGERYWISQGESVSLMGSIVNPLDENAITPDYIHFANWKRLNDTPWKLKFYEGRSFTYLPYSVKDSAVCYFYEPAAIQGGNSLTLTIFLTTEDTAWYFADNTQSLNLYVVTASGRTVNVDIIEEAAEMQASQNDQNADHVTLTIVEKIFRQFIDGEIILSEHDIAEIEKIIDKHRN